MKTVISLPAYIVATALGLLSVSPGLEAQVDVSLVAADTGIKTGKPLTVALRMEHSPGWHTYWLNPGIGEPTTVNWTLPTGWKAGPIQWPAPKSIIDSSGTVTGIGYEGDIFLPVVLTPPADLKPEITPVELVAHVTWLMCADQCVPGVANVHLKLPIVTTAPSPDPTWGAPIREAIAALPKADPAWPASATRSGTTVILHVENKTSAHIISTELHFFSSDALIGYDLPQKVEPDGRGGFILTLVVSPDGPQNATRLTGVLTSANGWHTDGSFPGLGIDVPFGLVSANGNPTRD